MSSSTGGGGGCSGGVITTTNSKTLCNSNTSSPNKQIGASGSNNSFFSYMNSVYLAPNVQNSSYSLSSIRKRKVKLTIQLTIQELLSVPYLNGVLFCKIRLCDGGNHVSYSSKKEVSNSSVTWSSDSSIQFEVKAVQLYVLQPANQISTQSGPFIVIGYEPCLCRVSVRKELRGGKSYQKLGYVDYNLSDFIYKYQQDLTAMSKTNQSDGSAATAAAATNDIEFCVNRILKEYETSSSISSKKNQQRLDNSYLKIKIKVIDTSSILSTNTTAFHLNNVINEAFLKVNMQTNQEVKLKQDSLVIPSITPSNVLNDANSIENNELTTKLNSKGPDPKLITLVPTPGSPLKQNDTTKSSTPVPLIFSNNMQNPYTPSHSRNSSLSTSNSITSNFGPNAANSSFVNGHNRSCSNGSIKSNVSFDYLIKNRNKKLIEEIQSTSSSSSFTHLTNGQSMNSSNQNNKLQSEQLTPAPSPISSNNLMAIATNINTINTTNSTAILSNKLEPAANSIIIETRMDANEIINQIENELANRINTKMT